MLGEAKMNLIRPALVISAALALLTACSPGGSTTPSVQPSGPAAQKSITISIPREPGFVAAFAPLSAQQATDFYQRMFSAFFEYSDNEGKLQPYLAEALPTLNTNTWEILPDGRMQPRYHRKPNLTWHAGPPLTPADFVFCFKVSKPTNRLRPV